MTFSASSLVASDPSTMSSPREEVLNYTWSDVCESQIDIPYIPQALQIPDVPSSLGFPAGIPRVQRLMIERPIAMKT